MWITHTLVSHRSLAEVVGVTRIESLLTMRGMRPAVLMNRFEVVRIALLPYSMMIRASMEEGVCVRDQVGERLSARQSNSSILGS